MANAAVAGTSNPGYSIWRVIMASSVGTMIEWYDFYIFGSLTAILALKFYPTGNDTFAYLAYLATFAVGFLVRPFGALFFGRIGDLVGRKYAFHRDPLHHGLFDLCHRLVALLRDGRLVRADRAAVESASCRDWRWAENTAALRFMWANTSPTTSAASTPASSRSRPRWVCSSRLS